MKLREAVVLAGGRSTRMGMDKALIVVDGETMLARQIRRLAARVERIIVSRGSGEGGPAPSDALPPDALPRGVRVDLVRDSRPGAAGPLAGVEAGLDALDGDRALFVAVDTPVVDLALVERLEAEAGSRAGAVPLWHGRVQGTFAIYSRALLPLVREMLDRGDGRVHALARADGVVPVVLDEGFEHVFRPLNTPGQLEAWRRERPD